MLRRCQVWLYEMEGEFFWDSSQPHGLHPFIAVMFCLSLAAYLRKRIIPAYSCQPRRYINCISLSLSLLFIHRGAHPLGLQIGLRVHVARYALSR